MQGKERGNHLVIGAWIICIFDFVVRFFFSFEYLIIYFVMFVLIFFPCIFFSCFYSLMMSLYIALTSRFWFWYYHHPRPLIIHLYLLSIYLSTYFMTTLTTISPFSHALWLSQDSLFFLPFFLLNYRLGPALLGESYFCFLCYYRSCSPSISHRREKEIYLYGTWLWIWIWIWGSSGIPTLLPMEQTFGTCGFFLYINNIGVSWVGKHFTHSFVHSFINHALAQFGWVSN